VLRDESVDASRTWKRQSIFLSDRSQIILYNCTNKRSTLEDFIAPFGSYERNAKSNGETNSASGICYEIA